MYAEIARKAAAEGAVLLRNEKEVLPLKKGEKLVVFGRIQFHYYKSGTGSGGMVNTKYVVGILDALKEEIKLKQELEQVYREWKKENHFNCGEGWGQEPWSQEEMLEKVCITFKRVIVVLNVGSIIDKNWVETYKPQAVLYTWQGGMEGGHAVADILMGRVNPCGKLADTIAREIKDYPSAANFGGEEGNQYVEDIYVGYRYVETFAKEKVLYPFGYALSYTSFEIKN